MKVFALKDIDTGLFWNRIHKDFRPLSQNTLFVKDTGQAKRALAHTTMGYIRRTMFADRKVIAVEIEIKEVLK